MKQLLKQLRMKCLRQWLRRELKLMWEVGLPWWMAYLKRLLRLGLNLKRVVDSQRLRRLRRRQRLRLHLWMRWLLRQVQSLRLVVAQQRLHRHRHLHLRLLRRPRLP